MLSLLRKCLSDGFAIPEIARTIALFRDQVAVACLFFAHHDAKVTSPGALRAEINTHAALLFQRRRTQK
jgi:hypothetical protein